MPPPEQGFRHLADDVRLRGWGISVVQGTYAAPDGSLFTRDVVRHPGAVAVVPVTEHDTILLVRQYRGPVDRVLLEIPAGTRDVEGEAPEITARRELEEEVGVRAKSVRLLGTMLNSPGFCDQETLLYLAWQLEHSEPSRHGEEERYIEVVEIALADIGAMIASGELIDAQTVLGLLLARDALRAEES
ncbi:MAG TPA: NUDIX hydrolase [Acidimicrobiales bacterium]|nr:NUDIX hydrolase [Acidimicrobiales bacterium]